MNYIYKLNELLTAINSIDTINEQYIKAYSALNSLRKQEDSIHWAKEEVNVLYDKIFDKYNERARIQFEKIKSILNGENK